jgi:hypothetical protein
VKIGALEIAKPSLFWINDGLMAVFFFLVGLEIKHEALIDSCMPYRDKTLGLGLGGPAKSAGAPSPMPRKKEMRHMSVKLWKN